MDGLTPLAVAIGGTGGLLISLLGGWDTYLECLVLFMVLDIFLGMTISIWKHKSPKTETGRFSSETMWLGVTKKFLSFFVIIIAVYLDQILGTYIIVSGMQMTLLRSTVIGFYIVIELGSIIENLSILNVPLPQKLVDTLEILKHSSDYRQTDDKPKNR